MITVSLYSTPAPHAKGSYIGNAAGSTMVQACRNAAAPCKAYLAEQPGDATVYAYDCLGGLRFELRKRGNQLTLKKTA